MSERYDFRTIEPKWQQHWDENGSFIVDRDDNKPKFYYLDMFPYPSGDLHMGHMRNYIIGDVLARYHMMCGEAVMHPMGWDAFGLPAENAAIQRHVHPNEWTISCIEKMKVQMDKVGISYNWERELNTSAPDYYKWTQWLFLQLYYAKLAYTGTATVNWCPSCATVLANEELDGDNCERCGSLSEVRPTGNQWFFKITDYADRLLDDLELLGEWPERVRSMQAHWIGRSEGVQFKVKVDGCNEVFEVYTTRIDTVYGVTYMVLAPEHPLVKTLTAGTKNEETVNEFVQAAMREGEIARTSADTEKRGIFTGVYAIHPLTGAKVPIWVGNYVLMGYGTGAIMAVPAHDQRDLEFAHRFGLEIKVVIQPEGVELDAATMTEAWTEPGIQVHSAEFDAMVSTEAKTAIALHMEELGIGKRTVNHRLRDWLISRQRYWGAPIPIIWCDDCGDVPVPEEDLPVLLPTDADFKPTGDSPLERHPSFKHTTCPRCGKAARRETDTMTTYVCSSWYYLRYASPQNAEKIFDREDIDYWLPVDQYVGGIEHAVRHLLYSRFITKFLKDQKFLNFDEPFTRLFTQGMIYKDGAKMSKSKGNVVGIDEMVTHYGADTARAFILFVGPPEQDAEWSDKGVEGTHRFLQRVWRSVAKGPEFNNNWQASLPAEPDETDRAMRRKAHQTIARVTADIKHMGLNTMISALMELVNDLLPYAEKATGDAGKTAIYCEAVEALLLLLSPTTPHLCEELWQQTGHARELLKTTWPVADETLMAQESIFVVVQVNGKVRERVETPVGVDMDMLVEQVKTIPTVAKYLDGKSIVKVILVPDKLINIVVK